MIRKILNFKIQETHQKSLILQTFKIKFEENFVNDLKNFEISIVVELSFLHGSE